MAQITQAELAEKYGLTRAQIGTILLDGEVKAVGIVHGEGAMAKYSRTKLYEERDAARAIIAMYNERKRGFLQKAADEAKNAARIAAIFRGDAKAGGEP